MDFEKLTDRARGFLQAAQTIAVRQHHQRMTPAHYATAPHDDVFVSLEMRDGVVATTWNGRSCRIDPESGALLSIDFVK